MAKEPTKVVGVRLPLGLIEKLQASADAGFRSLAAEVAKRLTESIELEEQQKNS